MNEIKSSENIFPLPCWKKLGREIFLKFAVGGKMNPVQNIY